MAYQQRGRLLVPIKTQVVPIGDLGLPIGGVEGLQYPDDLPPFLAVNTMQTPVGPRIFQGDSNGHLLQTLPATTQVNLIAPRTDAATFNSSDFSSLPFTVALFTFRITAISGTGAAVTFSVQTKDSQGAYNASNGGNSTASQTTTTVVSIVIATSVTNAGVLIGPRYRIQASISGTTPSITWYCDLVYK